LDDLGLVDSSGIIVTPEVAPRAPRPCALFRISETCGADADGLYKRDGDYVAAGLQVSMWRRPAALDATLLTSWRCLMLTGRGLDRRTNCGIPSASSGPAVQEYRTLRARRNENDDSWKAMTSLLSKHRQGAGKRRGPRHDACTGDCSDRDRRGAQWCAVPTGGSGASQHIARSVASRLEADMRHCAWAGRIAFERADCGSTFDNSRFQIV